MERMKEEKKKKKHYPPALISERTESEMAEVDFSNIIRA